MTSYDGRSPYLAQQQSINNRSRVTMSQGHYSDIRDSRIIAEKDDSRLRNKPDYNKIATKMEIHDSDEIRYLKTLKLFKEYNTYVDLANKNVTDRNNGVYIYDLERSKYVKGAKFGNDASSVTKIRAGLLHMPSYLNQQGGFYDFTEFYVHVRNLNSSFNNLNDTYHFKYIPVSVQSLVNNAKYVYKHEFDEFNICNYADLNRLEITISDKAGNIVIPDPNYTGVVTIGAVTNINSVAHGLQTGFLIYQIEGVGCSLLTRIYPITVVDADNFTIPIDTSAETQINNQKVKLL